MLKCMYGSAKCMRHLRALVHFFVDALDRQLDVVLDAVEDVLEVGLLIHIKLQQESPSGDVSLTQLIISKILQKKN